jgi:hypothetical protein
MVSPIPTRADRASGVITKSEFLLLLQSKVANFHIASSLTSPQSRRPSARRALMLERARRFPFILNKQDSRRASREKSGAREKRWPAISEELIWNNPLFGVRRASCRCCRRSRRCGQSPKLKTPAQVAADPRNKSLLYEVVMRCRRAGYEIEGDEYVDLGKLDKALDERGMRAEGWSLKTNLAVRSLSSLPFDSDASAGVARTPRQPLTFCLIVLHILRANQARARPVHENRPRAIIFHHKEFFTMGVKTTMAGINYAASHIAAATQAGANVQSMRVELQLALSELINDLKILVGSMQAGDPEHHYHQRTDHGVIVSNQMTALSDLTNRLDRFADRCAKLAHDLKRLDTDEHEVKTYAHRIAVHLADAAMAIKTTTPPKEELTRHVHR